MNLTVLLEMASSVYPDRVAIGNASVGMTYESLMRAATAGAAVVRESGAERLLFLSTNGPAFPVALFAASAAGVPICPLNYRWSDEELARFMVSDERSLIISADPDRATSLAHESEVISDDAWILATGGGEVVEPSQTDPDAIALLLATSGTSSTPKAAVLRHRHLTSYVFGSVELASAGPGDATLVSVPPYHIAGVMNLMSNIYACRRVVYLESFSPDAWLRALEDERVTQAMLVPTMLVRIVDALEAYGSGPLANNLRAIAYGGSHMPAAILERALALFPEVEFTNAYGLTETSSTIAVLGPEDHRASVSSSDPDVRLRLGSVGRVVPGVQVQIRSQDGTVVPASVAGEIFVNGPQVSGEYLDNNQQTAGDGTQTAGQGWFCTRDRGWFDESGYLFVEGRSDDTIIRGGENVAPAEVEDILTRHPAVADVAVFGIADAEWGQRIAAAVVLRDGCAADEQDIKEFARSRLRRGKTPDLIFFRSELPRTDSGKLLRRLLQAEAVSI